MSRTSNDSMIRPRRRSPGRIAVALVAALVLVVAQAPPADAATVAAWMQSDTGSTGGVNGTTDPQGKMHLVVTNGDGIWYVTDRSGAWKRQLITAAVATSEPSVAVDASAAVHVAFTTDVGGIRYATNRSGTWRAVRLTTGAYDRIPALASDPLGEVHIVYDKAGHLAHLTNRKGYWVDRELSMASAGIERLTVALDGDRRVHVAYDRIDINTPRDLGIWYFTNAPVGTWTTPVQLTTNPVGPIFGDKHPSIAVDGSGKVHIAYSDANTSPSGTAYITNRSGAWVVTRGVGKAYQPTLVLDAQRRAHIAGPGVGGLHYVSNSSGTWRDEVAAGGGGGSAIGLTPTGVRIGYMGDVAPYAVRVASSAGSWTTVRMSSDVYDETPAVAVDAAGKTHVVFVRHGTSPGIIYRTDASGSWVTRRLSSGADTWPGIAIDAAGAVHVIFVRGDGWGEVRHTTNASGSWTTVRLSDYGSWPAIAPAPGGAIRAVWNEFGKDGALATWAAGTWTTKTGVALGGELMSLVVDANGRNHIATASAGDRILRYQTDRSGAWVNLVVDSPVIGRPAVAVTATGSPRIAYLKVVDYEWTNARLTVASRTSTGWRPVEIGAGFREDTGTVGLVVDAAGKNHVSASLAAALVYATDTAGTWTMTSLGVGALRWGHGFAMGGDGSVHMVYRVDGVGIWEIHR